MINNDLFKPAAYISSDHPLNRHDAAHPRPNIPDAIVYEIFKYLSVEETCRVLTMCKSKMGEERFGALRSALVLKTSLTFTEFKEYQRIFSAEFQDDNHTIPTLTQLYQEGYLPPLEKITSLDLSDVYDMTDEELIALAMLCPNLTSIKIGSEYGSAQQITEHGIQMLGQFCPKLTSLELRGGFNVGQVDFNNYPNLTSITIDGIAITDTDIQGMARNCPKLKSIYLAQCTISDIGARVVAEHCPELSSLVLVGQRENQEFMTDIGIQHLARGCPNLTKIAFHECAYVTDEGIKSLANCPLTEVILSETGITSEGLKVVAEHCSDLRILSLPNSYQISDDGIEAIAKNCSNLEEINFSSTYITDRSVEALGLCPKLTSITLERCQQLTGSTFQVFEHLSELTYLNLQECPSITDESYKIIAGHCLKLKDCYLSSQVTPDTIRLLRQNHPQATIIPMLHD